MTSRVVALCVLIAAMCAQPTQASSQEELLYSELWSGAHLGGGVSVGPATLGNDALRDSIGYAVGFRLVGALIMQIFHVELDYLHTGCSASLQGDPLDFQSNRLSVGVGLHPLFLTTIFANRLWYTTASVYFLVGMNVDFNRIQWRDVSLDDTWKVGLGLGAGLDVPLDSPDDGAAFWLGFQYRHDSSPSSLSAVGDDASIDQNLFLLAVTYRHNGLPF